MAASSPVAKDVAADAMGVGRSTVADIQAAIEQYKANLQTAGSEVDSPVAYS